MYEKGCARFERKTKRWETVLSASNKDDERRGTQREQKRGGKTNQTFVKRISKSKQRRRAAACGWRKKGTGLEEPRKDRDLLRACTLQTTGRAFDWLWNEDKHSSEEEEKSFRRKATTQHNTHRHTRAAEKRFLMWRQQWKCAPVSWKTLPPRHTSGASQCRLA